MYFNEDKDKKTWSLVQGTAQFSSGHKKILDTYNQAKLQTESKPVKFQHGNVAEKSFRVWLSKFLPQRYGVTSGYVISPGFSEEDKLKHYDVIIYDVLNSPVLWFEEDGGESKEVRAIPVEHVLAVFEIKSKMSVKTIKQAKEKLEELKILHSSVDKVDEPYKKYLPASFFTGIIFFEASDKKNMKSCLNEINSVYLTLDKLAFVTVLKESLAKSRGELDEKWARVGRMSLGICDKPMEGDSLLSDSVKITEHQHVITMYSMGSSFGGFAFDILALLNGTYQRGKASTMHATGFF